MTQSKRVPTYVSSSTDKARSVTPNDGADIPITHGLYIGVTGDVAVVMGDGTTLTFKAAAAGSTLNLQVKRVLATGTTATNIIALY